MSKVETNPLAGSFLSAVTQSEQTSNSIPTHLALENLRRSSENYCAKLIRLSNRSDPCLVSFCTIALSEASASSRSGLSSQ